MINFQRQIEKKTSLKHSSSSDQIHCRTWKRYWLCWKADFSSWDSLEFVF